jgi:hypothetical protein
VGEKMMKNAIQSIKGKMYQDAYNHLQAINYQYNLESIDTDFKKIDRLELYCYLLYVLAMNQAPEMYILICEYLYFLGTPFHDIFTVIRYHLDVALLQNHNNNAVLNWIICSFHEHPDSPYLESELVTFAQIIIQKEPDNERAKEVLSKLA